MAIRNRSESIEFALTYSKIRDISVFIRLHSNFGDGFFSRYITYIFFENTNETAKSLEIFTDIFIEWVEKCIKDTN